MVRLIQKQECKLIIALLPLHSNMVRLIPVEEKISDGKRPTLHSNMVRLIPYRRRFYFTSYFLYIPIWLD